MVNFLFNLKVLLKGTTLKEWHRYNIERLEGDKFRALNDEPQFVIKKTFCSGWYAWESVVLKAGHDTLRLYYDIGNGYNETDSVSIAFNNDVRKKRFFYLPSKCRGIRFDPIQSKEEFWLRHFKFRRVPKWFALSRIDRKLQREGVKVGSAERHEAYGKLFLAPPVIKYEQYIEEIEPKLMLGTVKSADRRISILLPVYNSNGAFLKAALDSVLAQTYPNWELCIADDASSDQEVLKILEDYQARDSRIHVVFRKENGHISRASNSALSICTGEFVALMDHDDLLSPHALNEVACALIDTPSANIIYSDEDKVGASGQRSDPHFKSSWNPELLCSQNYISHLGVYRRTLLQAVEGFRVGYEGSQDYDLLLRCVKACDEKGIVHIPKVLYHWRIAEGSTAMDAGQKEYTSTAGVKALWSHFDDESQIEVEQGKFCNTYRVKRLVGENPPLVSLIIPAFNGYEITKRAIDSIFEKTTYQNYEILLIDNNSDDKATLKYFSFLRKQPQISVLKYPHAFNFSSINNFAAQHARGDIIGLINNDIEVISPEWLTEMVSHAVRPEIGCVGSKLYYPDGRIQHAGVILGIGGIAGHSHKYFKGEHPGYFSRLHLIQNVAAVTAAAMVVRKSIYHEVGGLDEENLAIAFNDVDFCLRVRAAGYENIWTPYAELIHHESVSRGPEDSPDKFERFRKEKRYMRDKWGKLLDNDPYYNPNLTLEREDLSLRS